MFLENKKILIAGAAGMTGTAIIRKMLDEHPSVKIVATVYRTEPAIDDNRIEYIKADLTVPEDCMKVSAGCDGAIMAANFAQFTRTHPWEHMEKNLMMNQNMLGAFKRSNVKRIVFISSATVYQFLEGHIEENQIDFNEDPHGSFWGYGWAMRLIEKLCEFLHRQYGRDIIIARAANIFGPYDKFNPDYSNFIPALIKKAVDRIKPYEVWGSPDVIRDVIYVGDFADAIVKMMNNNQLKFESFNLGSSVETKISDVVQWVLKYSGYEDAKVQYSQDKPTSIAFRSLNSQKARCLLHWQPEYTIEQGVANTVKWWIENKDTWTK